MKKLLAFICFMSLIAFVNAVVLEEFSLGSHGFNDLVVEGEGKESCLEFVFFKENPLAKADEFVFFSANAEFQPAQEGEASIKVSVNGSNAAELLPEDFTTGWARILLQRTRLVDGNNLVVACARTGKTITKIVLKKDSLIGSYKSPDFSQETAFRQTPSNYSPLEGETIEVIVSLKNYGSEATNARVYWRKEGIVFPELELIEGDTQKEGIVEPGKTLEMKYKLKLKKALKLDLPKAIAYYANVFGEEKKLESNQPTLEVMLPNIDLKGFFLTDESIVYDGKQANILLAIHNNGSRVKDIKLSVMTPQGIALEGMPNEIALLEEKETKYLPINLTASDFGSYELGCLLELTDYTKVFPCQKKTIEFKEKTVDPEIGLAGIIVIIGVLLYLYAYSASKKA